MTLSKCLKVRNFVISNLNTMKNIIYRSETRGKFKNDWLDTRYSFSFADYFDRDRMNFGALRVLNDDIIQPSQGFGMHPHDNMEIITIPLSGKLTHKDSIGHEQKIGVNEVQVMSAGTGIFHAEYNASETEEVSLFQIWIYPKNRNIKPSYDQRFFDTEKSYGNWLELVSGNFSNKNVLHINQDAKISKISLKNGQSAEYKINENSFGSFVFVIDGELTVNGEKLSGRDAIGISDTKVLSIIAQSDANILNIEVPEK
jgi:quercetin 2,3-dioxygenase